MIKAFVLGRKRSVYIMDIIFTISTRVLHMFMDNIYEYCTRILNLSFLLKNKFFIKWVTLLLNLLN